MMLIFTQEYHYSAWWPKSPFKQENVPFPAKDLEGIIYEVLTPQFNELSILNGQNVKVFGCNAVCTLNVRSGGNVHCFNFINSNEINIEEESTRFTVHRSGAMVTLENDDIGTFIKIPATLTSQNIFFENSPRILVISSGNVMLGSQVVTTTPEPIK